MQLKFPVLYIKSQVLVYRDGYDRIGPDGGGGWGCVDLPGWVPVS